jgi:hypothetical protein
LSVPGSFFAGVSAEEEKYEVSTVGTGQGNDAKIDPIEKLNGRNEIWIN